jgi:hypothetical protein
MDELAIVSCTDKLLDLTGQILMLGSRVFFRIHGRVAVSILRVG